MADSFTLTAGIEVDGTPLADDLVPLLEHVIVDDYLHRPDMFVLWFRDQDHDVLGRAKLKIGSRVKIDATALDLETYAGRASAQLQRQILDHDTVERGFHGHLCKFPDRGIVAIAGLPQEQQLAPRR